MFHLVPAWDPCHGCTGPVHPALLGTGRHLLALCVCTSIMECVCVRERVRACTCVSWCMRAWMPLGCRFAAALLHLIHPSSDRFLSLCPSPISSASHPQLGDIIKFYNEIFVPATKAFLLKLGHSSECCGGHVKAFKCVCVCGWVCVCVLTTSALSAQTWPLL